MLARLFQHRSQTRLIRFDEQIVAGAEVSDLVRHYDAELLLTIHAATGPREEDGEES